MLLFSPFSDNTVFSSFSECPVKEEFKLTFYQTCFPGHCTDLLKLLLEHLGDDALTRCKAHISTSIHFLNGSSIFPVSSQRQQRAGCCHLWMNRLHLLSSLGSSIIYGPKWLKRSSELVDRTSSKPFQSVGLHFQFRHSSCTGEAEQT